MLAVMLLAVSCRQEEASSFSPHSHVSYSGGSPIAFSVVSDTLEYEHTRASVVTSLSSFYVNGVCGTVGESERQMFNRTFSLSGGVYKGGCYWPAADPGLSYGFYASNVAMTPSETGPVIDASASTDVLCAFCPSPVFRAVNELEFRHVFARLGKVIVTAPVDYTVTGLTVTLTPKVRGTYSLYGGHGCDDGTGWSAREEGADVTVATAVGENAATDVYLVPGSYNLLVSYTLTRSHYTETFDKTARVEVRAGKINVINMTLQDGYAEPIRCTVSVEPWETRSPVYDFP